MSSFRPTKFLIGAVFVVLMSSQLVGCGFRPLHGGLTSAAVRQELAAIQPAAPQNRLDVEVYNHLRDALAPRGLVTPARYTLSYTLSTSSIALITERDSRTRRFDFVVTATYVLADANNESTLHQGEVTAAASYNVVEGQNFATLAAEKDAASQAAKVVSDDVALNLTLFFERRLAAAAP